MQYQRFRTYITNDFFPKGMGEDSHPIDAVYRLAVRVGSQIFLRGQISFIF